MSEIPTKVPFAPVDATPCLRQCEQQILCIVGACICVQLVMLLHMELGSVVFTPSETGAVAVCLQSLHKVFFEAYDWRSFILALGCSLVGMALMAALENLVLRPLLKGVCPSYFEARQAPATLPHQKFTGESDRSPTGTSGYPGGAQPSAPKMAI